MIALEAESQADVGEHKNRKVNIAPSMVVIIVRREKALYSSGCKFRHCHCLQSAPDSCSVGPAIK